MKRRSSLAVALAFLLAGAASSALATTYSDNGDGTVTDPTTGLIWMRCALGQTWAAGTCSGAAAGYTFEQANALPGTVLFADRKDWRVPNIRELQTIVDRSKVGPAIDKATFPNTPGNLFWSGTPFANNSDFAWYVHFSDGHAYVTFSNRANHFYLRLVRDGQSFDPLLSLARATKDYLDNGDGTVTHIPTALTWKRCAEGQTWTGSSCKGPASNMTADQAATYNSLYAGKSDWRLPTEEELLSLIDYTEFQPAINKTVFPTTPSLSFWSSSPYVNNKLDAEWHFEWHVGFTYGYAVHNSRRGYGIRLVRSKEESSDATFPRPSSSARRSE